MRTIPVPYRHASAIQMAVRLEQLVERLNGEVTRLTDVTPSTEAALQVAALRQELHGMATLISDTRSEVAGLLPVGMSHSRLANASDELDSVVDATDRAASEIMNAAEQAQEAAQRLRAVKFTDASAEQNLDIIDGAVLDIFMACSFQDLTGQRIRKVVNALTYIEKRVLSLSSLWQDAVDLQANEAPPLDTRADSHLLNGPSHNGLDQGDIDSLLSPESAPTSQDAIDALFA
jgi:chemotaxis protein CheZ